MPLTEAERTASRGQRAILHAALPPRQSPASQTRLKNLLGTVTQSSSNPFGEPDSFIDALADSAGCTRDLPFLQQLGVNVIRAYSVNSSLNHDSCMQALSQANIYTMYVLLFLKRSWH